MAILFYILTSKEWVSFTSHPHQYLVLSVFWILNIWINVSESPCFDLQFPSDIWCRVPFHMLICHLYIFIVEISVQIFCPFKKKSDHSVLRVLCMFWLTVLYQMFFTNIFSWSVACLLFFFLRISLTQQKCLVLIKTNERINQFFHGWCIPLVLYPKSHC